MIVGTIPPPKFSPQAEFRGWNFCLGGWNFHLGGGIFILGGGVFHLGVEFSAKKRQRSDQWVGAAGHRDDDRHYR